MVLTAVMRENFYISINACIAMDYDDDPKVRTTCLDVLSAFFHQKFTNLLSQHKSRVISPTC